jgi:hypothetical protein
MGKRVATVSVVWSGLGWWAYSPRSRLGLPDGMRETWRAVPVAGQRSPQMRRTSANPSTQRS